MSGLRTSRGGNKGMGKASWINVSMETIVLPSHSQKPWISFCYITIKILNYHF